MSALTFCHSLMISCFTWWSFCIATHVSIDQGSQGRRFDLAQPKFKLMQSILFLVLPVLFLIFHTFDPFLFNAPVKLYSLFPQRINDH